MKIRFKQTVTYEEEVIADIPSDQDPYDIIVGDTDYITYLPVSKTIINRTIDNWTEDD